MEHQLVHHLVIWGMKLLNSPSILHGLHFYNIPMHLKIMYSFCFTIMPVPKEHWELLLAQGAEAKFLVSPNIAKKYTFLWNWKVRRDWHLANRCGFEKVQRNFRKSKFAKFKFLDKKGSICKAFLDISHLPVAVWKHDLLAAFIFTGTKWKWTIMIVHQNGMSIIGAETQVNRMPDHKCASFPIKRWTFIDRLSIMFWF